MQLALKYIHITLIFCLISLVSACGGDDDNGSPDTSGQDNPTQDSEEPVTRSFYMGFTPWPYEATLDALDDTYNKIQNHGDLVAHHIMGGIPWEAALNQTAYHPNVEGELTGRINRTQTDKIVYLAIDSLNATRYAMTLNWGANVNEARPAPWDTRNFDDIEVATAYSNFALDLINRFNPDYFNYGTEATDLIIHDVDEFDRFVIFASRVYSNIKAVHPDLPLMVSVAMKSPGSSDMTAIQTEFPKLLDYIDMVGVSTYPYAFYDHADKGNPNELPQNWLSQITALAGGKPIAITETGWIAENLSIPIYSLDVTSSNDFQNQYLEKLLPEANTLDAEFVIWFSVVDFDTLWNDTLGQDDLAAIWRDIGLYDHTLQPRPSLQTWDNYLMQTRE